MFRIAQIAVGVALMSAGSPLLAAEIRWQGEATCRPELEVTTQVESMIARSVSSVEIADFEVNVRLVGKDQWRLELTTVRRADGARSTRAINGASCAEVSDAVAVAVALAIGPPASPSTPKNAAESPPPDVPAAPPKAVLLAPADERLIPQTTHPVVTRYTSLDWVAGLSASLDSSATPSPAIGAALHVGLAWRPSRGSRTRVRFELEGAFYAPTETSSVAGQAGQFQLAYVAPLVCGAKPLGSPTLLACAGVELGQLSGKGVGEAVTTPHPSNTFWSAARAELGLLAPLVGSLRFGARVGVAVPFVRREFVLDGPEVVFQPGPISARVELGLELAL